MKNFNYIKMRNLLCVVGLVFIIASKGISQLTVNNGVQTMTIIDGVADGQLNSVLNTTVTLSYTRPPFAAGTLASRITVSTACLGGQRFGLSVVATNVTKGTAQPAVTLTSGGPAMNLITNILRNPNSGWPGTCRVQFTASATFDDGNSTEVGNDVHTITYTYLYP